jgi:glycopeptide antibiotics resistance protein
MDRNKKLRKTVIFAACLCYFAIMLYLLFIQRLGYSSYLNYWDRVQNAVNLIPFHTITQFVGNLSSKRADIAQRAFVNLVGNIAMFIPLGLFLPYYRKKQRKYRSFILTIVLSITVVELLQVFTLLGSCDVDDLIFNTVGASIGFLIFKIIQFHVNHRGKRTK